MTCGKASSILSSKSAFLIRLAKLLLGEKQLGSMTHLGSGA